MECEVRSKTYDWHEEIMKLFTDAVTQREAATGRPDPDLAGTVRYVARFLGLRDRPALWSTCRSAVPCSVGESVHRERIRAIRHPGRYERRRAEAIAEAVRDLSSCVTRKIKEIVRVRREGRSNTYSVQPLQLEAGHEVRDRRREAIQRERRVVVDYRPLNRVTVRPQYARCSVCRRTLAEHPNGRWCRRPTRPAEAEAPFDTPAWNEFLRAFMAEVTAPRGHRRRAQGARVGRGREGPTARWRSLQPMVAEEPEPEGGVKGSIKGSEANSDSGPEREPEGECEAIRDVLRDEGHESRALSTGAARDGAVPGAGAAAGSAALEGAGRQRAGARSSSAMGRTP